MARVPRRSRAATPVRPAAGGDEFQFEPTDIFTGVLLLFVIPALAYVLLGWLGIPVVPGTDIEDVLDRKEAARQLVKQPPPLTSREYEMRIQRVAGLLQERVPEYLRRAGSEEKPVDQDRWLNLAKVVVGNCSGMLDELESAIASSPALSDGSYEQRIRSYRQLIASHDGSIDKLDVFSAVRSNN